MTSTAFRRAIFKPETDEVFLYLLTITHPDLDGPLRFVANSEDIVSRGETYTAFPFTINFPGGGDDQVPSAQVSISPVSDPANPDTDIVLILRNLGSAPKLSLETVLASQPDIVEQSALDLTLTTVDFESQTISGTLSYEDILNEPYPGDSYNPATWPGVFA